MRRIAVIAVTVATALAVAAPALASWGHGASAGNGASVARQLGAVAAPTAAVSVRDVTVAWTAPAGGAPPNGYTVRRYDGSGSSNAGGSCSGTVSALTCTDTAVPAGGWRYTVKPVRANWSGAESAQSNQVTVAGPALTLSTTTVTSFPSTLTGQLSGFASGQTVTYRLDNPNSGQILSGTTTPSTIPVNGAANVSVTIPAGTSNGSQTVYAIGSGGDQASRGITVNGPMVTDSVIAKSAGGRAGTIRAGGTYFVYANVSGSGSPPAGLGSLTADVSALTSGGTAVALSSGGWTVAGQSYNYRSAQQTAGASMTAGTKSYSLKLTDSGGTQTTSSFTVIVDNTKPTATDVQTTNLSGGTNGLAEAGDTLILSFSEQMEETSILAGWDGSATNVVVRLRNVGSGDRVVIYDSADKKQLPLGRITLGATDYTTANRTFGAGGTPSTMSTSGSTVTVTLGTASGAVTTTAASSAMVWTPSATATDTADNKATTTAATESGAADKDF
jgi:hypothetical protein